MNWDKIIEWLKGVVAIDIKIDLIFFTFPFRWGDILGAPILIELKGGIKTRFNK